MTIKIKLIITAFLSVYCIGYNYAQKSDYRLGVNELQYFFSKEYINPENIEFVFSGDSTCVDYFYSDLEKKIVQRFNNINISFRYLNKKAHYASKKIDDRRKVIFFLNINNAEVIEERNGNDRLVAFEFSGSLINKENKRKIFSFKSIVIAIHDINNKNDNLVDYLFNKIVMDKKSTSR